MALVISIKCLAQWLAHVRQLVDNSLFFFPPLQVAKMRARRDFAGCSHSLFSKYILPCRDVYFFYQ